MQEIKDKHSPEISVIMGVYNQKNEKQLFQAVKSILRQSFTDFEFIIYDDGSDEEMAVFIKRLQGIDPRLILIGKEKNHGLAFSLNECINIAKGQYIARMDADDISQPERLKEEYDFLEANPEYSWVGCNAEVFDDNGVWGQRKYPEKPAYKDYLRFSPFMHPSVMYRSSVFEKGTHYNDGKTTLRCEDYELFMRLEQNGLHGYNLQKLLFQYREDRSSFDRRNIKYRINESRIRYRNFKKMGMLSVKGWLYVSRPIIAGLIPKSLLVKYKRRQERI